MGINRYDKAPEWTPPVLPYELILKAADMTQQRWDKGVAEGDRVANDLFSKVKTVPTSVDEQVNLPAIRQEYQTLRSQLINDPEMNATKFQYAIQDFANKHRSTLDRMTQLAGYAEADAVTRNKNIADADWSAGNIYLPSNLPDWRQVDATQRDTPWETKLTSRGTANWDKFISDNYLKDWAERTQSLERDPVTGDVTKIDGKTIDDLYNVTKTHASQYMGTTNFKDWKNSGQYDNWVPDNDFGAYGKSYFGGKEFKDLSPYQQAQAMAMAAGIEQLTIDSTMTQGARPKSDSSGEKTASIMAGDPYQVILGNNTISTAEVAAMTGKKVNSDAGYDVVTEEATKSTISRLGINTDDPEAELNSALLATSEDVFQAMGIKGALTSLQNATDESKKLAKDYANGVITYGNIASGTSVNYKSDEAFKKDLAVINAKKDKAQKELVSAVTKAQNSQQYLNLVQILTLNGYDASSPSKVAESMTIMKDKQDKYKAGKDTTEQSVRDAISLKLFNEGDKLQVNYDGDNNIIDLGTTKVIRGTVVLGNEKQLMERLNNLADAEGDTELGDDLVDVGGSDFDGEFSSIEELNGKYPGMFVRTGTDKEGNAIWGTRVYTPLNLYDTKKHMNYDKAMMTDTNADVTRSTYMQNAPSVYIQDKINRTAKMMQENTKMIAPLKTAALSMVQAIPNDPKYKGVKDELLSVINNAETNKMEFSHVYQALITFGNDPVVLSNYFNGLSGVNPNQPQGQQGNPLGGLH